MIRELFEHDRQYRAALLIANAMLEQRVITDEDYQKINAYFVDKYTPVFPIITPDSLV